MDPQKQLWRLDNKKFLVTGGTKGIGLAVVKELISLGANVFICAQVQADVDAQLNLLRQNSSINVYGFCADLSTKEGRDALVSVVTRTFGDSLDGLINNVGCNVRAKIEDATQEDYTKMFSTNVDTTYFLCKSLQANLAAAGGGVVVNVASAAGLFSSGTGAIYAMTKGAVISLTKSLACEWAKYSIRVNAVAPWMTYTPMLAEAVKKNPKALDKAKAWTPMKRLADTGEISAPIVFLCLPASSYITGQCLGVDGGLTAQGYDGPCVTPES